MNRGLSIAVLLLAGCGERLVRTQGELELQTEPVQFEKIWLGHPSERPVKVRNTARAPRSGTLTVTGPFELMQSASLTLQGADEVTLTLRAKPEHAGALNGELKLLTESNTQAISILGEAAVPLPCPVSAECKVATFDPATGSCVESNAADDVACGKDLCLAQAHCQAGVCVGTPLACDDHDACTVDACGAQGCVHAPKQCAAPSDPCRAAACDPKTGCSSVEVADGTACGNADCVTSMVCVAGACVARPTPEGGACGSGDLCHERGRCELGTCQPGASKPLAEQWSYYPPMMSVPGSVAADSAHNLYFTEYSMVPESRVWRAVSLDVRGQVRWAVSLNAKDVRRGPVDTVQGVLYLVLDNKEVQARWLSNGQVRWSRNVFDLLEPEFRRPSLGYDFSLYESVLAVNGGPLVLNAHEDGDGPWRSWAVALDSGSGNLLWKRVYWGHLSSFHADTHGNVIFNTSQGGGAPNTIEAYASGGQWKWTKSMPNLWAYFMAASPKFATYRGLDAWLDPLTGQPAAMRTVFTDEGYQSVSSNTHAWSLRIGMGMAPDTVVLSDPSTGAVKTSIAVTGQVSHLLQLEKDGVLAFTQPRNVWPYPPSTLRKLTETRAGELTCAMPGAVGYYPVLLDGLLVAPMDNRRIGAISLPGLEPAKNAWSMSAGNAQRTGRPQ